VQGKKRPPKRGKLLLVFVLLVLAWVVTGLLVAAWDASRVGR
jgi:hypothetical protein